MSLMLIFALIFFGLVALGIVFHVLGFSNRPPMDAAKVTAEWRRHFPQDKLADILLSKSGRAALVSAQTGRGLLWQFGADTLARRLPPLKVVDHPKGLRLRFADLKAPLVLVILEPQERDTWREKLLEQ